MSDLLTWVENNQLTEKNFSTQKTQWKAEINKEPNFFSDTELLFLDHDILLLKVSEDNQTTFLAQTYKLEKQAICQKIFAETKNIVVISERQLIQYFQPFEKGKLNLSNSDQLWKSIQQEKAIVLLKDEASIKKSFAGWLAKKN